MPMLPARLLRPVAPQSVPDPRAGTTTERGYGWRWQKLRDAWLHAEPRLCVMCIEAGFLTPAQDVDHIVPHRGDPALLYAWANLQGLCHSCHGRKSQEDKKRVAVKVPIPAVEPF